MEGTDMRKGSISSYVVVASAAAILSFAVTSAIRTSDAQTAPAAPAQLLTQPLPDLPGREVRISLLDRAPQAMSPPHRHPGHHTFGYVLEGTYEPPGALHSVSRNPSTDQRVKILVFMVADQKNPSTVAQ